MTEKRCKQLMDKFGMPDSKSLMQIIHQVANETEQEKNNQNKKLIEAVKGLSNYLYDTQFVSKDEEAEINYMTENIDKIISEIEGE